MSAKHFDYVIIGAGAAGLQLALSMGEDAWFKDKSILILDPDKKKENDKTWCFWQKEKGKFESIVHKSWPKAIFHSNSKSIPLEMNGFQYDMLKSIDFYNYAFRQLQMMPNVQHLPLEVASVTDLNIIHTSSSDNQTFSATQIFDSRVDEEFYHDKRSTKLLQHFLGWEIQIEEDHFDPNEFTMMDYRERDPETTSFTYVLPFSTKHALVEFTVFSAELFDQNKYEHYLENYIKKVLNITKYRIIETEKGVIPMSDFPFQKKNRPGYMKIGTGGGWVKPSSGYSFKSSEMFIEKVIQNLKNNKLAHHSIFNKRNRFLDAIFLKVLSDNNSNGELYFETMYQKNPASRIFRFLDEKTSFIEELKILSKFASNKQFLLSFFKQLLT